MIHGYSLHFPTGLKINHKIKGIGKTEEEIISLRLNSHPLPFPVYISHCKTSKCSPEHLTWSPKEVPEISMQVRQHRNQQQQR